MNSSVQIIPLANLTLVFIPVLAVIVLLFKWSLDYRNALYAVSRMLVQLLLIGYFLAFIFESDNVLVIMSVLTVMLAAASWIALRTAESNRKKLFPQIFISLTLGGGITLALVTQGVLGFEPWYDPRFMIPLAGMIFANSLNSISLALERVESEIKRGVEYSAARGIALKTAMIPITNSLFAVGLVSLPGMMTGQILSGVTPLVAARYQIMVMAMIYGSTGMVTACFLTLAKKPLSPSAL